MGCRAEGHDNGAWALTASQISVRRFVALTASLINADVITQVNRPTSRGINPVVRSDFRFASPAPTHIAATPTALKPRTTVGAVGGVFFDNRIAMARSKLVTCTGRGAAGIQCFVERLPSPQWAFGRRSIYIPPA